MEIQVARFSKKITKAFVNQMQPKLRVDIMKHGRVLGFVFNVVKEMPKAIIIELNGEYFRVATNWTKSNTKPHIYRRIGKWSSSHEFESQEECDEWWKYYTAIIESKPQQIYI